MSKAKQGSHFLDSRIFRQGRLTAVLLSFLYFSAQLAFAAGGAFVQTARSDTAQIRSLLRSAAAEVNKPGEAEQDIRAAIAQSRQALQLSYKAHNTPGQVAAYTLLSQCFREQGTLGQGLIYAKKALVLSARVPAPQLAASANFEMSNYYNINSDTSLQHKIYYYACGLKMLERAKASFLKIADAFKFLGDLYQCNRNFEQALSALQRALLLYQRIHYRKLNEVYSLLGKVLIEKGDYPNGIRSHFLAVKVIEGLRDTTMNACEVYNNLGVAYDFIRDYPNALLYFGKARKVAEKNRDLTASQNIAANMAINYNALKQFKNALAVCRNAWAEGPVHNDEVRIDLKSQMLTAYTNLQQYALGRTLCDALIQELKPPLTVYKFDAWVSVGEYFLATRQFGSANKYIAVLQDSSAFKRGVLQNLSLERLEFHLDSARGDYLSAIQHQGRMMNLNIARLKKGYDKQLAMLQVRFELKEKNQDIAFKSRHIRLLMHQNQLQNAALRNQQLIRNLSVATAVLLLLLSGLYYNRYQIKQRAHHDLQEQQEEINTQNESLKQLLMEREWLLKEVHHRVKNNLQIVISLLNSQLANIKDVAAMEVLRESQHRMRAISLIHQKLYQADNLAGIDARSYIQELASFLQDSFDTTGHVRFTIEADPVILDVSQAVPVGLILNEAVTNTIKYAFTGVTPKGNCVHIRLSASGERDLQLIIRDNGRGLPEGFDYKNCKSLGMQLMNGLSRQIRGRLSIVSGHGLTICLNWQRADVLPTGLSDT